MYWYANTLVESVNLNQGRMDPKMIESMNSEPTHDEKVLAHFQKKLQSNY